MLNLASATNRIALLNSYSQDLLDRTIPFWFPRCIDERFGGFLHCLDQDGSILDTDKSVWAQGRMSWMLLTLYNTLKPNPDWLAWAESGLDFLRRFGFDRDGHMFFHLAQDGTPIRKRRYAYSEAFTSIAFAAHFKATQDPRSAELARKTFAHYLHCNFHPQGMAPKFTEHRPTIGLAPRMIAIVTAQELRSNLGPDPLWNQWIDQCISEILGWFVKPDRQAVMECVAPDGSLLNHMDCRVLNPGHAIEGAWFILREGIARTNELWIQSSLNMMRWMLERGWDPKHGGLLYFVDIEGKPVQEYWHDMKFWWPHNEAIIATLLAYEHTQDPLFAEWHARIHDWSRNHFFDEFHGEWFGYLHRDGSLSQTAKGNLWKSFFHYPRMLWACQHILTHGALP